MFAQHNAEEAVQCRILTYDPHILTSPAIWHEASSI